MGIFNLPESCVSRDSAYLIITKITKQEQFQVINSHSCLHKL